MAVLNIRVPDEVRDQLKTEAEAGGMSMSEYVRDLLLAAVLPVHEKNPRGPGDEPAPESLSMMDRKTLSMLHRILARVLPEDANGEDGDRDYQLQRAEILEEGFTGEYWWEVAGFRTELSVQQCDVVIEILQMFRIITFSLQHLEDQDQALPPELVTRLRYRGFDHNDPLEAHMAAYVRYMMSDEDKWTDLRTQLDETDRGNSHMPMLATYQRMLTRYRRIKDSRGRGAEFALDPLTADELAQIVDSRLHSDYRDQQ